jgi:uncharacterized protein (TIGR02217 family)
MSNAIFPTFPGLAWSTFKTPEWSTAAQRAVSGKEVRMAQRSRPVWQFSLSYEVLRGASQYAELQKLMGFFNARQGSFDSFLYSDPTDNSATAAAIGVGDGVTTTFKLTHYIDGWSEPIGYAPSPVVYINGVQSSAFTCADGVNVVFNVAPPAGAILAWTGSYYFRVRFTKDSMEFEQFMKDLWLAKKCDFVGVF